MNVFKVMMLSFCVAGMVQASLISTSDYGTATHTTTKWQSLGKEKDGISPTNNGVFWSVNGGEFNNSDFEFKVGDIVTFKFELYKEYWGVHSFDGLTAWIDPNEDGSYDAEDLLLKDQWNFNKDDGNSSGVQNYYKDPGDNYLGDDRKWYIATENDPRVKADSSQFFTVTYTFGHAGEYNLRARVTCSADLNGGGYQPFPNHQNQTSWVLAATGSLYQGEVEDYKFTVSSVPEPTMISLLGLGLLGLAAFRRKK